MVWAGVEACARDLVLTTLGPPPRLAGSPAKQCAAPPGAWIRRNAQSAPADLKKSVEDLCKESTSSPLKFMRWWNVLRLNPPVGTVDGMSVRLEPAIAVR